MNDYEYNIGLEVHVELNTKTKAFCSCKTEFAAEPNTNVCPVCLGLPGALPLFNMKVAEMAVTVGKALNCEIFLVSYFDRKNYFYPDLPKAYQITQFYHPICRRGYLTIETERGEKKIGIERIHIEEDAGKLIHSGNETKIDFNRGGVPLLEIVSEPALSSADEVKSYIRKLRSIILFCGVSDCKMNEGSMRCDINLSVRPKGCDILGERTEMKNLNSVKFAAKAVEYEAKRQISVIESGGKIVRETRRFNSDTGQTEQMRSKEGADDYRYFPEPDLPPLVLTESEIRQIEKNMPRLPDGRIKEYSEKYSVPRRDGENLTETPEKADFFEKTAELTRYPRSAANMILTDIPAFFGGDFGKITPEKLAALCDLFGDGEVNSATVKKLLRRMGEEGVDPVTTVDRENLRQINSEEKIREYVISAIEKMPTAVESYKKGKKSAAASIVGKAMGESSGRLNPQKLTRITEEILEGL